MEDDVSRAWEILVVDDSVPVLIYMSQVLQRALPEARIHLAVDAAEGLQILGRHPVELIVSDHLMPGMDGVTFLARAREAAPSAMRFLLTGEGDLAVATRAINEGHIHAYHAKPMDRIRFVEKAKALLEQGLARRQRYQAIARDMHDAARRAEAGASPMPSDPTQREGAE